MRNPGTAHEAVPLILVGSTWSMLAVIATMRKLLYHLCGIPTIAVGHECQTEIARRV